MHCDPRVRPPGGDLQAAASSSPCPSTTPGFVARENGHPRTPRRAHRRLRRRRARRPAAARGGDQGLRRAPDARDRRPADAGGRLRGARALEPAQRRARCARSPTSRTSSAGARASISQCGYNTALDLLRTRVPALVVPYATPEEDEQTRRARRLEQLGVLKVATHINGDIDALLRLHAAPRRRSTSTARPRPRSCCERRCAPTSSSSGARCSARRWARSCSPLAELAKPWPIALIVDHVIGDRQAPFDVDMRFLLGDRRR